MVQKVMTSAEGGSGTIKNVFDHFFNKTAENAKQVNSS
jgi:hypothetical protein